MDPQGKSDAGGERRHGDAAPARWPTVCWVAILALIGVVQVVRAQEFDAVVFFAAAGLVIVSRRMPQRGVRGMPARPLVIGAAIAAAVMSLLPRHSVPMMLAVLVTGAAAVVIAWRGSRTDRGRWPRVLRRLGVSWAVILVAGCVWELIQFIIGEIDPAQPSYALSDLVDPMLGTGLGRVVFIAAWLGCGVFLLRRGSRS